MTFVEFGAVNEPDVTSCAAVIVVSVRCCSPRLWQLTVGVVWAAAEPADRTIARSTVSRILGTPSEIAR